MKIAIIGDGRVGGHLLRAFTEAGAETMAVKPRTLEALPDDADLYLISVADGAVIDVASKLPETGAVVAHTSGSVGIEALQEHRRRGVLYPLQTFSHERALNYKEIPFFTEASDAGSLEVLSRAVDILGAKRYEADSEKRRMLHLASVFCCNFANKLWDISDRILAKEGLPSEVVRPLMKETLSKLDTLTPREAQTGPAVRGDIGIIRKHEALLEAIGMHREQEIYDLMSRLILDDRYKNNK